jgi:acetylornithine deacetylase
MLSRFSVSKSQAVELLKQLIAIPRFSREEAAAADFLESFVAQMGYFAARYKNNIWLMSPGFDTSRPTILLNSHIDTVKPTAGWTRPPHCAVAEGERLYGLGSNDAGASLVGLLFAFCELTKKQQPCNLIYAATCEEEISGSNGIEAVLPELPEIDFAVVGEPTGMDAAVAEKGLMVLDCTAKGKAGHAARNEGENAIYRAMKDMEWFRNYEFEKKSEFLGNVKMTVTQISAGTQHNVVPDRCTFVVDIRSNELYSNVEILRSVKENVSCEVRERSLHLNSSKTPENHPFVERAREAGCRLFGSPTMSDQSKMKFASVKIGPGDSARSHTADEFILFEEIENSIERYYDLLDNLKL